jgi:release factor glutamine methyltransferase
VLAVTVDAADISPEALAVASENVVRLGAAVHLIHSDLFAEISGSYDVIVSNPPYIRTAVIEELEEEVRCHEPYGALDGREDGLYFYRAIVSESRAHLRGNGMLLFEIGYDQAKEVSELMAAAGFAEIRTVKDLAGLDRVVLGRYTDTLE